MKGSVFAFNSMYYLKSQSTSECLSVSNLKFISIFRAFCLCIATMSTVNAGEYIDDESVSPNSVEHHKDPISYGLEPKNGHSPNLHKWLKNLPKFFRESTLTMNYRTYGLSRITEEFDSDAITIGGEIYFLSGTFVKIFRTGVSYYVSHDIQNDNGEDTLLLGSNGRDINVLGKLYLEVPMRDTNLRMFRQTFNLPYLNKQDNRMIPVTHEGYVLTGTKAKKDFILGHVTQQKRRNTESFISMGEAAGADDSEKGLSIAGFRYSNNNGLALGAINYYTEDIINIFYSELNYTKYFSRNILSKISGQFTHQKSFGHELIGEFDTNHYGLQIKTNYRNAILTIAGTKTGSNAKILSPFGGSPSFLSSMLQDFDRANELGFMIGVSYDFSNVGLSGLSTFGKFALGSYAKDDETGRSLPNLTEYNISVDYKPEVGILRGFWFRLRHARADFSGGEFIKDSRMIINYRVF